MKNQGKFIRTALEYITQCVLFPGVALPFENVIIFYKENLGAILKHRKKN